MKDEINSGNGYHLFLLLKSNDYSNEDLDKMLDSYMGLNPQGLSICSSELFSFLEETELEKLFSSCNRICIDYKILFLARSPIEYCISNYSQLVKRHGEVRTLLDYLNDAKYDHFNILKLLDKLVASDRLVVRHYDDLAKKNIVKFLFDAVNISYSYESLDDGKIINRSFSVKELDLMLLLNKILGAKYSREISDLILSSNENSSCDLFDLATNEVKEIIKIKFLNEVEWLNFKFNLNIKINMSEVSHADVFGIKTHTLPSEEDSIERRILLWIASELANSEKVFFNKFRDEINFLVADRSLMSDIGIPLDFNPVVYLILNPDLIENRVNPYYHYINFAKNEMRKYKYF